MKRLRHASGEPAREATEIRIADFSCKTKKRRVEPLAFGLRSDLRAKTGSNRGLARSRGQMVLEVCRLLARSGVTMRKISRTSNRFAVMRRIENHQMCWDWHHLSSRGQRGKHPTANWSLLSTSQFKGELNDTTDTVR